MTETTTTVGNQSAIRRLSFPETRRSDILDRDLPPQLGGGLGVVLDMLSLLDELVFGRGAGETALRGEARSSSGDGS
jgi:hypothetical protein